MNNEQFPVIIFKDRKTEKNIGKWLGEKNSQKIKNKFSYILRNIGIDLKEICMISMIKDENYSCYFYKLDSCAQIILRYGNQLMFDPELMIKYKNIEKTYNYYKKDYSTSNNLKFRKLAVNQPDKNKRYGYYYGDYSCFAFCKDGETKIEIDIHFLEKVSENKNDLNIDKVELKKVLSEITFPIRIEELYNKLKPIFLKEIEFFPIVEIKILDKEREIVECIKLNHGELINFAIRRNDKVTILNKENNYEYITTGKTKEYKVQKKNTGIYRYELNLEPKKTLDNIEQNDLNDQFEFLEENDVKKLIKFIFK